MPQFPMTDSRRKVLEQIPDYAVVISPYKGTVTIKSGDTVIAETHAALLIQETRHGDVYYLPRKDVDLTLLVATELSTYCPFKGHASYWSYKGNSDLDNFVWSYEEPYEQVEALTGYMSFYTNKVDQVID
jgi:uncharacterized protein (DUF427 family)